LSALLLAGLPATASATTGVAPGGPGATSWFDLARKDCVGTATGTGSKVWYTVTGGVLSDVYEPTVDNTNVSTLQYVVTDGHFTDLQTRDLSYTVAADPTGMACTVTATSAAHGYQLVTTYITDPGRDTVLLHTELRGHHTNGLHVYARLDAHVNGNGGGGTANRRRGHRRRRVGRAGGCPTRRPSARPRTGTMRCRHSWPSTRRANTAPPPSGYAGTASDGLTALDATHTLGTTYDSAPNGHIVAVSDVTPRHGGGHRPGTGVSAARNRARSMPRRRAGRSSRFGNGTSTVGRHTTRHCAGRRASPPGTTCRPMC